MKEPTVKRETFLEMLSGLIATGVTFDAYELTNGDIKIAFTGGY